MSERILVPYDGSEPATDALGYALDTFPDPEVTVLYVVSIPEGYWTAFETDPEDLPRYEAARDRGEEIVEEAAAIAADHDQEVATEVVPGVPSDRIVRRSEDDDVDLIVIGSHGREGLSRILLGSVAETVVQRAPVPVMVVR